MARKGTRGYNATQGSVYLITSDGRTLRLPIPSESPNEPLNWSSQRVFLALSSMSLFTIIHLILAQGTSLLLNTLEDVYSKKVLEGNDLATLSYIPTLMWGIGALVWVPVSMAIGRRPVFLFNTILLTFSALLAGISQSFRTHLIARCLQGIAGSISLSVVILMIIDVTYIHQRPLYIAAYWCLCSAVSCFALALTPAIVSAGETWRAFYWVWAAPSALNIILAFLWCPETYFDRPPMAFDGHILSQAENGKVTVYKKWDEVPEQRRPTGNAVWTTRSVIKKVIFWNRSSMGGWSSMKTFPAQILICVFNPLIFWVLLLNATIFGGMVVTCNSYVGVLQAPPYNFSFQAIGLAKISTAIGAILAFPLSGILTSYVIRILAARNRGVREPEHYLPSFIVPVIVAAVSLGLYGIALERKWAWEWILVFVGLDYSAAISIYTTNALWVTEAFPRWSGAGLVTIGNGGYAVSFAMSFAMVPWVQAEGLGNAYVQLAAITLCVGLIGIPVNWWGKRFREYIYLVWERVEWA